MLVAQHTLNERTLEVQVGTPKASSVPSLKEFFFHRLICHLETDVMLFHPKDLMWLSNMLCGSLPDWLNQYSFIEASIATNCPSLTVQKCGLCQYMASLSDIGVSFVS
jgi:hypothetical protein